MKQLIKQTNQSAKILEIYVEYIIHRFNSNNNLLHTKLVPINVKPLLLLPFSLLPHIEQFSHPHSVSFSSLPVSSNSL